MVIAWLKRILEILNKTIAAADAAKGKDFLPAERFCVSIGASFCDPRRRVGINQGAAIALTEAERSRAAGCPAYFSMERS